MGAGADEDDEAGAAFVVDRVGEQEVAADVAFAMSRPIPLQRMIEPLGAWGPSLAISSSMTCFRRDMSYRPERDRRSQSLRKVFV
ncbi:hypothetical protein AFCDBAGC_0349 [Methylobacterium cerastii]|uniref:Uncharacterized protein n=1 Tax=Methylobacterium cerastii TaxID=932741 RepID=A0ABQ4QBC5_9HYPH|nr:hypothetical protein AFCDBAGC_0349 [Methylobacterium cerastii]